MRKIELNYILNILQGKKTKTDKVDFNDIFGFLELNKISGYFYNRIKNLNMELPQQLNRKLNYIQKIQSEKNNLMRKWIGYISDEIEFEKINFAVLKGSLLSNANINLENVSYNNFARFPHQLLRINCEKNNSFYKDGERISNDIDILINPKDITAVTKILKNMGFVQGYYDFKQDKIVELGRNEIISRRMNRGETAPFLQKLDNPILPFIEIDLNFSIDYLPTGNEDILNEMLSNTSKYEGKLFKSISSLNPEHFLIHLIMHQYKESVVYSMVKRNKDLELYKLLDIYLFLKAGLIDKQKFLQIISKYNLKKEAYFVLKTVSTVFNSLNIEDILSEVMPDDLKYLDTVIDPENKNKNYYWKIPLLKRLYYYDKLKYLSEAENG